MNAIPRTSRIRRQHQHRHTTAYCAILLLSSVSAFIATSPRYCIPSLSSPSCSSVALYGVRSALKRRFGSLGKSSSSPSDKAIQSEIISTPPLEALDEVEMEVEIPTESVTTTAILETNDISLDAAPITVPPIGNRQLTKIEYEFRNMMLEFSQYTVRDIQSVPNPRFRAIFHGIAAGALEPAVYRAFEVVYGDLIPLRIAGRMIFERLKQVMADAKQNHQDQVTRLAMNTGLPASEIESGRLAFLSVAKYQSDGEAVLNIQQLVDTGIAETAVELLGYDDFQDFVDNLDRDQTGKVTFETLMVGLQRCGQDGNADECNPSLVLRELAARMESHPDASLDARKQSYSERYDEMVNSFVEWEEFVPKGDGRRLDILRGCFVGARNPRVVDALRIVYCDYSALRMAGDLIFGIVSKVVNANHHR